MARTVEPREKIVQKSTGYHFRQHEFFNWCRKNGFQFDPDPHARYAVDEQIANFPDNNEEARLFLSENDPRHPKNKEKKK